MNRTRNDLSEATRVKVGALLNARLSDALDLGAQLKVAHWNVKGPGFVALHELFDEAHAAVQGYSDDLAERAVQLGCQAFGTARQVARASSLVEYPDVKGEPAHVAAVADVLAGFGKNVRAAIDQAAGLGDAVTADLFTEVSRGVDKWLWLVESHLG